MLNQSVAAGDIHTRSALSTGSLLIYCGSTPHRWHPDCQGFLGGAEEAVINLARALQKLGWSITVYNNCGDGEVADSRGAGRIVYRPHASFDGRARYDVAILWRWPRLLDHELAPSKLFLDLHDAIPAEDFTEKRLGRVTKVLVKSAFHRSMFPNVPDEKLAIIPNGIDLAHLRSQPAIARDPYLLVNTSSPDRSMDVLPDLFKKVKERVPRARLQWAYGWEMLKPYVAQEPAKMRWIERTEKAMAEAGIETLGHLSHADVGKLYQRAAILAYPTEFAEIDCLSARKAQAAGCYPITTDFGALAETVEAGVKIHSSKTKDTWLRPYQFHFGLENKDAQHEWVEAVTAALEGGPLPDAMIARMQENAARYAWPCIASRWHDFLSEST